MDSIWSSALLTRVWKESAQPGQVCKWTDVLIVIRNSLSLVVYLHPIAYPVQATLVPLEESSIGMSYAHADAELIRIGLDTPRVQKTKDRKFQLSRKLTDLLYNFENYQTSRESVCRRIRRDAGRSHPINARGRFRVILASGGWF